MFTPAAFRDLTRHDRLFGVNAIEERIARGRTDRVSLPLPPSIVNAMLGIAKRSGKFKYIYTNFYANILNYIFNFMNNMTN